MIFDPSSASHLKPWLVRTLEPICDAEPGALADYILALLKHNVPEGDMRKELAVQLDEFLEKAECSSFIDTLFTVLRTKSYLPYAASPLSPPFSTKTLDTGIPIPLDGLLSPTVSSPPERNRKRSIDNDERDGRPPAKGPRLSTEGQFSRYNNNGNGNGGRPEVRSTGGWGGRTERFPMPGYRDNGMDGYGGGMMNMGGMNGSMGHMNGRRSQAYQPPDQKRGICRDYHNSGYCARGAMCKYSHGEDAVVPGQLYPMSGSSMQGQGLPFMPMFPNAGVPFGVGGGGANGAAYDPHESRMDMRPMGGRPQSRAPLLPRIQQEDGVRVMHSVHASGELPVIQDLTPSVPPDTTNSHPDSQSPLPPQPIPTSEVSSASEPNHSDEYEQNGFNMMQYGGMNGQPFIPINMPMDVDMAADMRPPTNSGSTGGFRGGMRGGGRGRGTFGGEVHSFRPERRNDKTLVVEKIPEDRLTLEHVNGWFKRFGTVTNVAIDSSNAKALVSFANHEEAYAAWKSQDAVFSNRFVKLFWHRPMEGHGQAGARMLAASAPLVANITTKEAAPPRSTVASSVPVASTSTSTAVRKSSTPSAAATALAAKQQLLEKQIAEQKSLMASLSTASPEEKKEIMARLRKLGDEMKHPSTLTDATPSPSPAPSTPGPRTQGTSSFKANDHEQKERERLDKELEMHNATVAVEGETGSGPEDLKAKLERLKAEAASLGLADGHAEPSFGGSHRPYRGRGRGARSYYRGAMRGGPPRASMKLDNRPKKLLVKGVNETDMQALRDWYETTGQVESLNASDNGDVIVAFKSRAAAEQGLAKGLSVPTVGPVKVTWYTGNHMATASLPKASSIVVESSTASQTMDIEQTRARSPGPILHSPHPQEEEVVATGWGSDGDGEDGMGML